MMWIPVVRLVDGVVQTLTEAVLPDLATPFARGQLYAAVDVLKNLRDRVEPRADLADAESDSALAALDARVPAALRGAGARVRIARALASAPAARRGRASRAPRGTGRDADGARRPARRGRAPARVRSLEHLGAQAMRDVAVLKPSMLSEISRASDRHADRLDDYPLHQTAEPIAQPATGDRNFYDRYFFNGYTKRGDLFFAAALGVYPNRRVMDAAFSVVQDGRQWVVRASRLAPLERTETTIGPISVEVIEPLRVLRLHVGDNAYGLRADLTFTGRTAAIEEPRFTHRVAGRLFMDATRLTQFGAWSGALTVDGTDFVIDPAMVLGSRDRSWGVRPIGEPESGAPGMLPQFFWLWAPINFDDVCVHFDVNEDGEGGAGTPTATSPASASSATTRSSTSRPSTTASVATGTRRAANAASCSSPHGSGAATFDLEPILTFQMRGLGYFEPEWGHGMWKGELAVGGDVWTLADLDPLEPRTSTSSSSAAHAWTGRDVLGVLAAAR
jgi:hypothetical protein